MSRHTVVVLAFLSAFALAGCSKSTPSPGGSNTRRAEHARKEAESLALNGVNGAATAQAKAMPELAVNRGWIGGWITVDSENHISFGRPKPVLPVGGPPPPPKISPEPLVKGPPTPKSSPRPGTSPTLVRERVVSDIPYATEAEAEADALAHARELVEKKLAELDPPVHHKVSLNEVKTEFLRQDSRTVRPPDAEERERFASVTNGKLVYVEYDVEVTTDQVRELRSQDRVGGGLRVLGMLFTIALAGYLFLRTDEWTRGYLTSWLALGACALAGGAAAALLFV